jgi:uncharacterized tellurite resistance protein B-like protein
MTLEHSFQENFSRDLENMFFIKEDQKLIEKLRALKKLGETKEELSRISGIKNDVVLQKLVDLNVRPETLASITLVPLVEVAWADGTVDEAERNAVLKAVEHLGFASGSTDYELVLQWMTHKPSPALLEAWVHYIAGLCEELSEEERTRLKEDLLGHTREVAMTSGGFLGLGNKISKEEAAVLSRLENAFG